ncbi:DNA recombinase [Helicobacter mustelae]|uniref:tyrosine-type recombinase/integrase n=1 Tax=Helicobacter mustelae TaxID=217 RepID=UPI000DFC0F31|nr:tyrosine-type recombinase/integrase [Helicobacter mustelae]STP12622.1 DNA recombinase [Helicobacter mustelae]
MKYPLELSSKSPAQNLLDWLRRFLRNKITTLSNRFVKNREKIFLCLEALQNEVPSITRLQEICKMARNSGLIGINTYANPLMKFYEYIAQKNLSSLKEIDEEVLNDFLAIYTSALSTQTRKNYRIALLGLFGYIDGQNEIAPSQSYIFGITLKIPIKNASPKLPAYLKKEEIEGFLNALQNYPSTPMFCRDRAIIKLIIYTGMRISEALYLGLKDLRLEGDFYLLNVRGKGDKTRVLMVRPRVLQEDLKQWLTERAKIPTIQNHLLFCNKHGAPLSQAYIYRMVDSILQYAGIKKEKMGAHMLRHSFATLLYQKHKDLILVQETLGHASLDTSRIYTHFDKDHLYKAASLLDDL